MLTKEEIEDRLSSLDNAEATLENLEDIKDQIYLREKILQIMKDNNIDILECGNLKIERVDR